MEQLTIIVWVGFNFASYSNYTLSENFKIICKMSSLTFICFETIYGERNLRVTYFLV